MVSVVDPGGSAVLLHEVSYHRTAVCTMLATFWKVYTRIPCSSSSVPSPQDSTGFGSQHQILIYGDPGVHVMRRDVFSRSTKEQGLGVSLSPARASDNGLYMPPNLIESDGQIEVSPRLCRYTYEW